MHNMDFLLFLFMEWQSLYTQCLKNFDIIRNWRPIVFRCPRTPKTSQSRSGADLMGEKNRVGRGEGR